LLYFTVNGSGYIFNVEQGLDWFLSNNVPFFTDEIITLENKGCFYVENTYLQSKYGI